METHALADWLTWEGREKLVWVFKGMLSRHHACISSLLIKPEVPY